MAVLDKRIVATLLLAALAGCSDERGAPPAEAVSPAPPATAAAADVEAAWRTLRDAYIEAEFAVNPTFAVQQGRHEHDGIIPDLSATGIEALIDHHRDWRDRALALDPAGLDARDAFERELLIWHTDSRLFWLETARWPFRNPEFYGPYLSPSIYVTREYAPPDVRLAALTRHSNAVPRALTEMRANLANPLPAPLVDRAIGFFGGMAVYLERDVPRIFEGVGSDEARLAFDAAIASAAAAYRETADWLATRRGDASVTWAMGETLFTEMLRRTELIEEPLEEIDARNRADLARNRAALEAACAEIAPGRALAECVQQVDANKPAAGPVARGTEQLAMLRQFLIDRDIVSIPLDDEARVAEAPPYRRANLAYIEIPGPYERTPLPSIYYIAPPDPAWSETEQRAYLPSEANLLFVSAHEVWPGHFLQGLHRRAHAGPLGSILRSYAFGEGWAHYTEEMMWDAGLGAGDPTLHVGQLVQALQRNVRHRSAIGLHTAGMTLEESERLFREEAFLDPGNARQQAARGTYDPAYLNYTLGKLEILDLRADWRASRDGDDSLKAFHDALLGWGAPPIPLVRRYLLRDTGGSGE